MATEPRRFVLDVELRSDEAEDIVYYINEKVREIEQSLREVVDAIIDLQSRVDTLEGYHP